MVDSMFEDKTFADFKIQCATTGQIYDVHRNILACHSEYFRRYLSSRFAEVELGIIELKEDHPNVLDVMINYFYKFDYSEDGLVGVGRPFMDALDLDAQVFAIADKYEASDLEQCALKKFCQSLPSVLMQKRNPLPAITTVYESTPASKRGLRDVVGEFWFLAGKTLAAQLEHGLLEEFFSKNLAFTYEMAMENYVRRLQQRVSTVIRCSCGAYINCHDQRVFLTLQCDCGKKFAWQKVVSYSTLKCE